MAGEGHLIWIVLDAVRMDHLSCYGYSKSTTPNLEQFCESAIRFDQAISASVWTLPSFATLLSGLYPSEHRCDRPHPYLDCGQPLLSEILDKQGYRTFFLSNNSWLSELTNFHRGFQTLWKVWQLMQDESDPAATRMVGRFSQGKTPFQVVQACLKGNIFKNVLNGLYGRYFYRRHDNGTSRLLRLLKQKIVDSKDAGDPQFWLVHILEPHLPHQPQERYFRQFIHPQFSWDDIRNLNQNAWDAMCGRHTIEKRDLELLICLYDAAIAYTDECLGNIFDALKQNGLWDKSTILITADHGEHLGEHGFFDHQYSVYEPLLRVPLLLKLPNNARAGEVVDSPVSSIDHIHTLLEICEINGEKQGAQTSGRSYLSHIPHDRPVFAEYVHPQPKIDILQKEYPDFDCSRYDRWLRTVRKKGMKFIIDGKGERQLFDLNQDPCETNNLINERRETAVEMESLIENEFDFLPSSQSTDDDRHLDEITRKRLQDLGYL